MKYDLKQNGVDGSSNEEKLIREFITNFIETNSISEKNIIISLHNPAALIIKRANLPNIPEKEISDAVKWELRDEVSFDLEKAQIDWLTLGEYADEEGVKRKDILVTCVKRDLIDKYVQIAKEAGLTVIDVKSPPFNYSYILGNYPDTRKCITSVLDVGANGSTFSIYNKGILVFLRNLSFGSDQVTASMSEVLISDENKIKFTREKAEEIKKEFGIPEDPSLILRGNIKASHIISLIRPNLERLVSELTSSLNYYAANYDSQLPETLYITGGGSNLKRLDVYLGDELKLDVKRLPMNVLSIGNGIDKEKFAKDITQLVSPLGATLGINKKPNLLPREYKTEKSERAQKVLLRLITLTIALAFSFSLFIVKSQLKDYQNRLNTAKLHLQTINKINELHDQVKQRVALVKQIRSGMIPTDWTLKELSNLMPASGLLEKLELDHRKKVLSLNGYIISREEKAEDELTTFMEILESSPFFGEAILRYSIRTKHEEYEASKFEICCDLICCDLIR